ncbi:VTT domain-containing protein [Lentilactobacillus sunkii]|uniref:DedA protein (DSG-1 protein) n=1 Tax=Lentilactobacillus sunkii DSM 19904 TaxID=1423808 RepID=A0A0R1LCR7_9LACO|nr:DedA protein (DSG-1 protein) [Lentilactobacillus sunkii DSM 19904]
MITIFLTTVLHLSTTLPAMMANYGAWVYGILFLLVFAETGLVVAPFLPGDSILFLFGSLAAFHNSINIYKLIVILSIAATIGDFINFHIGRHFGSQLADHPHLSKLISPATLQKSQTFFARHGNVAVFLGRFVSIIRTLVPFTAGMSGMLPNTFMKYNVIGGISWVMLTSLSGFFFGNVPFVKENFQLMTLVIVLISTIPMAMTLLNNRFRHRASR